jgi:hypothetical protein
MGEPLIHYKVCQTDQFCDLCLVRGELPIATVAEVRDVAAANRLVERANKWLAHHWSLTHHHDVDESIPRC